MKTIQQIVIQVGDSAKYGIEFGKEYNFELILLINDQLKTEGKSIIKVAIDWKDFQIKMGQLMVRERQGLATKSQTDALKSYFEDKCYPAQWERDSNK